MEAHAARPSAILTVVAQMARDLKDVGCLDYATGRLFLKEDAKANCIHLEISQKGQWADLKTLLMFVEGVLGDKLGIKVTNIQKETKAGMYEADTYIVLMRLAR